jgi:hypothetical protein
MVVRRFPLVYPLRGVPQELQQYIDDLTQEKYELQRGMEQQSKLAASLASENEQLTQDFNNMVCPPAVCLRIPGGLPR